MSGWGHELDLVIVGGGGMTAALTAHDGGLSAVVVEEGAAFGGGTGISGGGIPAGERPGAALDPMDDAWWTPAVRHAAGRSHPAVSSIGEERGACPSRDR